jgi:hypothetical protein
MAVVMKFKCGGPSFLHGYAVWIVDGHPRFFSTLQARILVCA